jgi:hypothetical protein
MPPNNTQYKFGLSAFGRSNLPNPLFKLSITSFESIKNVVNIRPGVMLAFVPAVGTLFQCLIIAVFVLLD